MNDPFLTAWIVQLYAETDERGVAKHKVEYIANVVGCSLSQVSKIANANGHRRHTNGRPVQAGRVAA